MIPIVKGRQIHEEIHPTEIPCTQLCGVCVWGISEKQNGGERDAIANLPTIPTEAEATKPKTHPQYRTTRRTTTTMSVATQLFPGMFPLFPAVDGAHHTNENSTSSSSTASSSTTDSSGVRVVVCKRSSRRRVRFADTVTYHEAPPPPAVSQDEEPQEESSWYTSREYEFLRQLTLRQAQQVSDLESNNLDEPFSYQRVWERIYTALSLIHI